MQLPFGTSNDSTTSTGTNRRARLVTATTVGGGTATFSMPRALDEISATPGNRLTQGERKHRISVSHILSSLSDFVSNSEIQEISSSPRGRVGGYKRYARVDNNNDELSTTVPPSKRARYSEADEWGSKKQHQEPYRAMQSPAPQLPAIQHQALRTQQTREILHQNAPRTSREPPFVPIPDAKEQSRQLHRILLCPADAYYDILSLANGTERVSLVEASWLDLSFMLHPRICPLPDAVKALSRVHDAYAWIQKHPGSAQPYVSPPPMPPLAQDTLSASRASVAGSLPRVNTATEPQRPWDSPNTQSHLSPQQPRSGPARVLDPPPPRTFASKPSSHIYVSNGRPTIRPAVGWQFREHGGETRVWYDGRWRPLIQSSSTFQGLRVDEDGWIMPIMNRSFSESKWKKVQGQAKLEFNSHP